MDREDQKSCIQSPLIHITVEDKLKVDSIQLNQNKAIERAELYEELRKQLWLAGPLVSVSILNYSLQIISVMFVGHLGQLPLSAASMATSFASVTGFSLLVSCVIGSILIALGQDHEISVEAGQYARLMIPSLFAYGLLQCLNRFLQTQNILFPMVLSSGVTTLLHIAICWTMVFKSGLGYRGAAIANAISYWINVFMLILYVKFSPSLNTSTTVWMIPFGLSGAVSTRVSNELGAGHPQAARLAVYFVFIMAVIEGTLIGAVMILLRNIWGYAYSNEVEVVQYVAIMLPILALSIFLDALQCVLSGTARGCGWQKIGAFINLGSYYLVGIPSAIFFSFVMHIGGKGLWLGIICALVVQVSCLFVITTHTDWEQEAKKAKERVYNSMTAGFIVS
ncbi:Protein DETOXIFICATION 16 [Vigna angularis]|uniref:Protein DETOXIFICATION 16 n=1 Tax=Phaseolus angularis TaxID=3914 RepID=A0A8T0LJU1_PHAAN|nr:Protein DETOXIFICATION 16 [Vigna angularis]